MPQTATTNRRIVVAAYPKGKPTEADFRLEEGPVPVPDKGELLLRTLYLSLDPYMRGRMSDSPSYAAPVPIGGTMIGATIARVVASKAPGFATGDLVLAYGGWQDYAVASPAAVYRLPPGVAHPSWYLGVLGMPGYTGYMGLTDIGQPKPGETVVVAAATGAVGSVVGQVAKLLGCRAVGIAGGSEKCGYAVDTLGFDACIDHRGPDLAQQLATACPKGIDVYFENVGGAVFQAVVPLLNAKARVPVCGLIAQYNADSLPSGPDLSPLLMRTILTRRIRLQGFIILLDYPTQEAGFRAQMTEWLDAGKITYREDVVEGLESAPGAFLGLLEGRNFGKLVVQVAAL
jgi:NADPH-dependent curcumin reductase CurA